MSKRNARSADADTCPCGSGRAYAACCGPLHAGQPAANAEALMRSRYSAFARGLSDYIQRSWHPSTRPPPATGDVPTQWLGLRIERVGALDETHATVAFSARYKVGGRAFVLRETSRFVREDGHWFYVDGLVHDGG